MSLTRRGCPSGLCRRIPRNAGRKPASMRSGTVTGAAELPPLEIVLFPARMSAVEPMFLPLHIEMDKF